MNAEETEEKKPKFYARKKICRFCSNKDLEIDYKNRELLSQYITDRAKILPRRITGVCAYHQRQLKKAIKRARVLAILPFTS